VPTRDTPPPPPVEERETEDLLEELGLALRDAANWSDGLPDDARAVAHVERVQRAHAELARRGVEPGPSLAELSERTGWLMAPFLEECLRFPVSAPHAATAPEVRAGDGVRHWHRCPRCRAAELPDKTGIWLCDGCLAAAADALRDRTPLSRLLVFRSYSPEKWCAHADAETVLVAEEWDEVGPCYCARCVADEQQRRAGLQDEPGAPPP
jgi:hypothetical protein